MIDNLKVILSQGLMLSAFGIAIGEGVSLVQVGKDLDGVLLCAQVGKHPVEMLLHIQRTDLDLITVERHQVWFHTKSTGLIQTTATATGTQLTQVGDIHLTQGIQVQTI